MSELQNRSTLYAKSCQDKMVMLRHHQEEYKQGCVARGVQPYHYNHVYDMLFRGKIFGEKRKNAWYVNMASLIDDTVTRRQELEGQMRFGKTFTATPLTGTLKAQVTIPVNAETLKLIEDLVRVGAQVQLVYK